jgi:hypothetical protein
VQAPKVKQNARQVSSTSGSDAAERRLAERFRNTRIATPLGSGHLFSGAALHQKGRAFIVP